MEFNLADLFECVADRVGDRTAVVWGDRRLTYRELDERATRLAHALQASGVGHGDHVGVHMYSRPEFLEAMLAAYKARAVPINVNYRYVADELAYLFDNADLVALVHEATFGPTVASLAPALPRLTTLVAVADGTAVQPPSVDYEALLAAHSADRDFGPRSADDHYVLYTGGTTGMPKGVVWRQEDIFFATLGGTALGGAPLERPEDIADVAEHGSRARLGAMVADSRDIPEQFVSLAAGPLMHASGQWSAFGALLAGSTVVLYPGRSMDIRALLRLVERERVTMLTVVGDAVARPLVEELEADPGAYDTSSVLMLGSGGSILSSEVKERLLKAMPTALVITEAIGSSESPVQALSVVPRGTSPTASLMFDAPPNTIVLDADFRPVAPGSGVVGRLATSGRVPIGYYKDAAKSAESFIELDGVRWSLPGDMATVEPDGTIRLLGRGSLCINTGGEKVYPEEVEAVLKAHPDIADALVVGASDPRWGERVTAVVAPRDGHAWPGLGKVQEFCRQRLAGYKVPRDVHVVDAIERTPSGKADYRWARAVVAGNATPPAGGSG
ncbi:MAG TPA: acyl-CoA synthetase [Acidimicrobiales bacterium]|nr:acyl-CoA synthetase [Acidimicrobiales bacterium]